MGSGCSGEMCYGGWWGGFRYSRVLVLVLLNCMGGFPDFRVPGGGGAEWEEWVAREGMFFCCFSSMGNLVSRNFRIFRGYSEG